MLLAIKLVVLFAYYPSGWLLPVSGLPGHPLSEYWLTDAIKAIPMVTVVILWWPHSMTPDAIRSLLRRQSDEPPVRDSPTKRRPPCVECGSSAVVMAVGSRDTYCEEHASKLARTVEGDQLSLYWIYDYPQVRGRFRPGG